MKLKKLVALFFLIQTGMLLDSCKHDPLIQPAQTVSTDDSNGNGSIGNGNNNGNGNNGNGNLIVCDPDTVYFQNDVLPFFVSNCAMSSCHNAQSHEKDIILDSYTNIISTGDIQAFDVSHGKIYESITATDPDDRMPLPPRPAISSIQADMIKKWINQGALNNVCIPGGGCDTSNVTFSGIVAPLLQAKCNGCHNSASPGGNVNLTSYSGVHAVALSGRLLGAVNHSTGYSPMPKNLPQLPNCEIAQIRIWIEHGSLNN